MVPNTPLSHCPSMGMRMSKRKADPRGAFYTPRHIVDLIVEQAIGRLCDEFPSDRIPYLKILDPSCGEGAFLTGAYSYLQKRFPSLEDRLLQQTLYGADIDESALGRTREALPHANLRLGDSLLDPKAIGADFDAVIGNPPWMSLAGRFGIDAYSDEQIIHLRERFGGSSYMPNLFEYFISLGLELTRHGGYFSYIVPDRLAFNKHFADLRKRLLSETELISLVYGIPFPGITADTMVFGCRKGSPGCGSVGVWEYGSMGERSTSNVQLPTSNIEFPRPQSAIVERMDNLPGRVLLGEIFDITSGFGGKSSLITEERVSDSQIPVLRGSSIVPYQVRKRYWFEFRKENRTGRTWDKAKLSASPKILIRKTGDHLIAAYDDSDAYPEQSLYFLYNKRTDLNWHFILGLLNSETVNLYYRARCLTNRRTGCRSSSLVIVWTHASTS